MKKFFFFVVVIVSVFGSVIAQDETGWAEITRESKPWTRWWWLGSDVDSLNLTYNLDALSKAGIGGVEITPIYGVKNREKYYIDYLSPRWMKMLAFTESEAKRLGMSVDMNNGTGWPFGGPTITLDDAATKAIFKDGRMEIGKTMQKVKRAAPGGQGYVLDHLNKEAVKRYLETFDKALAESGTPSPHSFFNDSYEVYGADWTPALLQEFEQRRGYRLQDYFPELLADGASDTSARVIADYRQTISELLLDNFAKVWTDWAHSHGATTRYQAHGSPGNLIDLYASADIPECESFGITDFNIPGLRKDSIRKLNDGSPAILKYASSAAHITGKKYSSSETFTWLTDHFRTSLSQCKPEIDQMFTSGVNHVFFHGAAYSPKEATWPGWKFYAAIDMSPTNTIWRDAPAFFDYIARTQSFLQTGKPDNDFLLYYPMSDIWFEQRGNYYLPFAIHDVLHQLTGFNETVENIRKSGFDLDYISDSFLQNTTVENGKLKTPGGTVYKALVFPDVKQLPVETLATVYKLAKQGATIIFLGSYPNDVPGLFRLEERRKTSAEIMQQLRAQPTVKKADDYTGLSSLFNSSKESFVTNYGGQMIRRVYDDGHIYFFTMLDNQFIDNWVALGTQAQSAVFFDPMTGKKGKALLRNNQGQTEVYMQLEAGQSVILKTFANKDVSTEEWAYYQPTGKNKELTTGWKMYFIESEPVVKSEFQLPALTSWTELPNDTLKKNMGTARYKIQFDFQKDNSKEYRLCLGDVRESAVVTVNGQKAGTVFAVPFEINIGKWLKTGENTLEIDVTNLPANRIADYDQRGVEWRIFNEINVVNINYNNSRYDIWSPVPSGLLGPVTIKKLEKNTNYQ